MSAALEFRSVDVIFARADGRDGRKSIEQALKALDAGERLVTPALLLPVRVVGQQQPPAAVTPAPSRAAGRARCDRYMPGARLRLARGQRRLDP